MTKERKLAIQMWEEIVNMCQQGYSRSCFNIVAFKIDFCKKHNLNWDNCCYFCQYCRSCSKCPLGNHCSRTYGQAVNFNDVASATKILNAIKGINK